MDHALKNKQTTDTEAGRPTHKAADVKIRIQMMQETFFKKYYRVQIYEQKHKLGVI